MGHARALLSIESAEIQRTLAVEISSKNLSVRETERIVKTRQGIARREKKEIENAVEPEDDQANVEAAESRLSKRLGAQVKIKFQKVGGLVEIKFASRDDLSRLFDILIQNTRPEGL